MVLSNSFVVHRGLKDFNSFHKHKENENKHNWKLFNNVSDLVFTRVRRNYFVYPTTEHLVHIKKGLRLYHN